MYEYKVVPAPSRMGRIKGLKTPAERFAHTLSAAINAEANGGWQFLRTETLSCEERTLLGRVRVSTQTVMVFARALAGATQVDGSGIGASGETWQDQAEPDLDAALEAYDPRDGQDWPPADGDTRQWDNPEAAAAPAPRPERPVPAPRPERQQRQEPLFRSGALLRGEPGARIEPRLGARDDRDGDD